MSRHGWYFGRQGFRSLLGQRDRYYCDKSGTILAAGAAALVVLVGGVDAATTLTTPTTPTPTPTHSQQGREREREREQGRQDNHVSLSCAALFSGWFLSSKNTCCENANDDSLAQEQQQQQQQQRQKQQQQPQPQPQPQEPIIIHKPLWIRFALYRLGVTTTLPLPRVVQRNDPDLIVSGRLVRQRVRDSVQVQKLQQRLATAVQNRQDVAHAQALVAQMYETLYGPGVTPQYRTEFLQRYGCTGWNNEILQALVDLGVNRGYVEMGAGHGQWARALQEYRKQQQQQESNDKSSTRQTALLLHPQTMVRAYDDGSRLPLNPAVYHANTVPHAAHFGHVRPLLHGNNNMAATLAQFENRGRILLLVYPPAESDMAAEALQAYTAADAVHNNTLVYVGEGRGGANATDAFFDALEEGNWILLQILPGVPCGTKGQECVYVFQKRQHPHQAE